MTLASPYDDPQLMADLRMQRATLERVASEIAGRLRSMPVASDESWRSDAARAFARNLAELDELLRAAWNALDAAVNEVDRELAAVFIGQSR